MQTQLKYDFSKALINNIKRTFTYAYAKNAYGCTLPADKYDPVDFFVEQMENHSPFDIFMDLERYGFKTAKKALDKYGIPYTTDQERRARIFYDVTEKMQEQFSDSVYWAEDDLEGTGVVSWGSPYNLTTRQTVEVNDWIKKLPPTKTVFNIIHKEHIPKTLRDSKEQMDALETCLKYKYTCLIGGAGTGKSFVTSNIIKQLIGNNKKVAILAPTHKAREALQEKLEVGRARTIHSFVHSPREEEDCDVIVIDESSMLSTPLFSKLLSKYDDQQMIFVGDKNQLPPIEYGRPFELLQERIKVAELKANRRSESRDIIGLGREILGQPINANMETNNILLAKDSKEAFEMGAEVLLTFTNKSVQAVNEQQRKKTGDFTLSDKFRVGDIIIAKTNDGDRGFYNGQLFDIVAPDKIKNQKTGKTIAIKTWQDLDYNFDLAYGLTIHKSQGSEWDVVAYQPSTYDTRNLAYVAVTRAKKKLIIVGDGMRSEYKPERKWKHLE